MKTLEFFTDLSDTNYSETVKFIRKDGENRTVVKFKDHRGEFSGNGVSVLNTNLK